MSKSPTVGLQWALAGVLVGVVVRVWLATLRVRVVMHPSLEQVQDRAWILAFWHGTQWPLLAWRRRRKTVVLVSLSRDGAIQARVMALQGLRVVRGSSSRGAVVGLAALLRAMKREGTDAAFAVDGPRGPYGIVKPGAIAAARASKAVVVPMAGAVRCGFVLRRTWDRFAIAWPFTSVDVVLGPPIDPQKAADARGDVERTLHRLHGELRA
ncbi:MAG: DUF374 domain-containing protein [Myxococcota bacterium]|nr:DUF374 domain-containing protein [Myxococcota bacterium]